MVLIAPICHLMDLLAITITDFLMPMTIPPISEKVLFPLKMTSTSNSSKTNNGLLLLDALMELIVHPFHPMELHAIMITDFPMLMMILPNGKLEPVLLKTILTSN